jgi:hypothetical protein
VRHKTRPDRSAQSWRPGQPGEISETRNCCCSSRSGTSGSSVVVGRGSGEWLTRGVDISGGEGHTGDLQLALLFLAFEYMV